MKPNYNAQDIIAQHRVEYWDDPAHTTFFKGLAEALARAV